jgi:hypothetical protein
LAISTRKLKMTHWSTKKLPILSNNLN